jgi:mono/diheme cytochrome c family protein
MRAALLLAAFTPFVQATEDLAFFEKNIRPLLTEHCLECHGEKKTKGGLRLDTREGWLTGGDAGPAIVPGEPDKSLLITAVRYTDRDLQMPEKRKLPDAQIALLEQWVKMGAPDPRTGTVAKKPEGLSLEAGRQFWSYRPVQKPTVPTVQDAHWPRNDIDRFILAKIEAAGLKPAPDAAPEVLARRLSYQLTGLPPSLEGNSDLDTLLASPHFGEHFGQHWLDVARFAESSGGGRTLLFKDAWRYRDYVIEAFNANLPFDHFIREQLAGDLLPASTPAERRRKLTATAFLALGPTNYEEQDKQQLRFDIIDEQLETIGKAFLGQTIGCARCHDHKFDPIPQRDYYALAGIFASTRTLFNYTDNVARWIAEPLPMDAEKEAALRKHEAKAAALNQEFAAAKAALAEASKSLSAPTIQPGRPIAKEELPGIILDDADAKLVGAWKHSVFVKTFIGPGYVHDENAGKGEKTITFTPTIPQAGRYEVRLAYTHAESRAKNVRVAVFHADGEEAVFVDQSQPPPIDGRFVSLGKFRFEKDGAGYVLVTNENTQGFVTVDALQLVPESTEPAQAPAAQSALARRVQELEAALKALKKDAPARDTAMTVADDPQPAGTHLRVRGVEKQRGELVPRGFLQVAQTRPPTLPENQSGRRELADWIASPENPLTARVFVNRVWTWLFGAGLVRTVDNFGTTGEKPTHPELLDFLAARFLEQGWDVKWLVREIVSSRTWQQAVGKNAADPENKLFAHASRRRLEAGQIRDAILAASGQLALDYLGPNIQGAGDIDANDTASQNTEYQYEFTDTRRSVYTPAFRNRRLELFEVFDFADINASVGQRHTSTVAPQALYLLNHSFVVEQARAAAERTLALPDSDRLPAAFHRTLGRAPSAAEREKCTTFLGATPSLEAWAQLHQALFACVDFRYLE